MIGRFQVSQNLLSLLEPAIEKKYTNENHEYLILTDMSTSQTVTSSDLGSSLALVNKGKVRDIYSIDATTLLFVTTDRVSAFDVVLNSAIPNKGAILTLMTAHWSRVLRFLLAKLRTHCLALGLPDQVPASLRQSYWPRSMQVHKCRVFKIEAIVRGYLTREAWDSYQLDGTVCGIQLPEGLREGEAFPHGPLYTPSTKADPPEHDEDISEEQAAQVVGSKYAERIKELSLEIFKCASEYALGRGVILVDTKFEFGLDEDSDEVVLIDEILTPESSRFWPAENYEVGKDLLSLDKQYLRDWLVDAELSGQQNVDLPMDVVSTTEKRYKVAFERLVGKPLEEVVGDRTIGNNARSR